MTELTARQQELLDELLKDFKGDAREILSNQYEPPPVIPPHDIHVAIWGNRITRSNPIAWIPMKGTAPR